MFNKCQSISRVLFPSGKSTYKTREGRSCTCLSWFLVMPPAVHDPGDSKHPGSAAESAGQGQSLSQTSRQVKFPTQVRWAECPLCLEHLPSQGNPCWGCSWCPSSLLLQWAGSWPPELWKYHFLPLLHVQSEAGKEMQDVHLVPINGQLSPRLGIPEEKPQGQTSCAPLSRCACEDKHRHAQNTRNPLSLCCQKGPDVNQQSEFYKYMKTSSAWF